MGLGGIDSLVHAKDMLKDLHLEWLKPRQSCEQLKLLLSEHLLLIEPTIGEVVRLRQMTIHFEEPVWILEVLKENFYKSFHFRK